MKIVQQLYIYNCMCKINYLHIKFVSRHYLYIIIMIRINYIYIMKIVQQLYIYNCMCKINYLHIKFVSRHYLDIIIMIHRIIYLIMKAFQQLYIYCNGRVSHPAALVTPKRACFNNPLLNRTWKSDVWRTSLKSGLEVVSEDGVWWWRGWWWWRWVLQGQEWGLDKMMTIDGRLQPDNKRLHWNRRVYFQFNRYMLIYSCSSMSSIY